MPRLTANYPRSLIKMNTLRVATRASLQEETIRDEITLLQRLSGAAADDVNERPWVTR